MKKLIISLFLATALIAGTSVMAASKSKAPKAKTEAKTDSVKKSTKTVKAHHAKKAAAKASESK